MRVVQGVTKSNALRFFCRFLSNGMDFKAEFLTYIVIYVHLTVLPAYNKHYSDAT